MRERVAMADEPNMWRDKFEAGETNLAGANFCYITLTDADFSKCNLDGASFVGATLVNCKFSSVEVDVYGKVTKEGTTASLKRTNFEGATLTNANFAKAYWTSRCAKVAPDGFYSSCKRGVSIRTVHQHSS